MNTNYYFISNAYLYGEFPGAKAKIVVRRRLGVGRPKCEAKCKARLGVYFSYSTMFKPQIRLVQL